MDSKYEKYLRYSEDMPYLFTGRSKTHTVNLENIFSLPKNEECVCVKRGRTILFDVKVTHNGEFFVWQEKEEKVQSKICNGDIWEYIIQET